MTTRTTNNWAQRWLLKAGGPALVISLVCSYALLVAVASPGLCPDWLINSLVVGAVTGLVIFLGAMLIPRLIRRPNGRV